MNGAIRTARVERVEMQELVCWRVHGATAELLVAEQGAQILGYQEHGRSPLIWLSEQAVFHRGESARGGVPVCWPWFGDLARNPATVQAMHDGSATAAAHGLVRAIDWQLDGIDEQDEEIRLNFSCNASHGLPGWPHAVELNLEIRLGERLRLSLHNHNRGVEPVALSQALHSYFAVSDIRQVSVEGLHGCRYIETLDGWQERQQDGELRFTGETDRIYLQTPELIRILDPGWQRQINLQASGSHSAVLWNPWIDRAQRLSHFVDDAWQRMLCIETANVLEDTITLAPGEEHRLDLELWSETLA